MSHANTSTSTASTDTPPLDFDRCYRAVESRDGRFDGWFITGVTSTGIYCRPSCPTPIQPKRKNVQFFRTAAAAQRSGLRACKRCRPDASPGSPEWDLRADLAGRAMRLITDGVVDREGVSGLASRLAVSERNLGRILQRELGASPIALARAQRATTARILIETTELPFTELAFAAGFSSIRQFNDTVREVFALTPSDLRSKSGRAIPVGGSIGLRLAVRQPFSPGPLVAWIRSHAPDGAVAVEAEADRGCDPPVVRRTMRLPNGHGVVALTPATDHVWCEVRLDDFGDLTAAVTRVRRLLDLDADPTTVHEQLDGTALGPLIANDPGLRVPGAVDGFEQAVMTILGQQVSVSAGRTFGTRFVSQLGEPLSPALADDAAPLTHVFPAAASIADADLSQLGITGARQRTITKLARAVVSGELDLSAGADRERTRARLLELPGIGPWTADIVLMRAMGDPDVFPVGDLILRRGAGAIGLSEDPKPLAVEAEAWSPWRSYAAHMLWHDYLTKNRP